MDGRSDKILAAGQLAIRIGNASTGGALCAAVDIDRGWEKCATGSGAIAPQHTGRLPKRRDVAAVAATLVASERCGAACSNQSTIQEM